MNTRGFDTERSLIATVARIDAQIAELDALLLKSLTVQERHRITDELECLKIQRRNVARKLKLATTVEAAMLPTAEQLWNAIERIAHEDGAADKILPAVIAKLIEFKMVELSTTDLPQLTPYGEKCYLILESGDDTWTEIDDLAAMEDRERQRQQ